MTVEAGGTGANFASLGPPHSIAQSVVYAFPNAGLTPHPKHPIDRAPLRKVEAEGQHLLGDLARLDQVFRAFPVVGGGDAAKLTMNSRPPTVILMAGLQGSGKTTASAKLARHFANLFEAPVLFYAACIAGITLHMAGALFLALAWVYVVLRMIHTAIHTGANKLYPRITAYFSSWLVLLIMWVLLAMRAAGWV